MFIYQLEKGATADYASEELSKYIELMCGIRPDIRYCRGNNGIVLGLIDDLKLSDSGISDKDLDDVFEVKVDGLCGYIAGSNIRSILYGVYAFLKKAGCRFIRPGKDGDYIPKTDLFNFKAELREGFSYRYRCDCIEGTVSYEVLRDYIYWLPKIGFNGYMLQGTSPYLWYDRYYSCHGNKYKTPEPLSVEEADIITHKVEMDIKRSGLALHSVGHDYMAPAFGLFGDITEEDIDKLGMRDYIALVKGERKIKYNHIRYTNLCYSNPNVRRKITEYFVNYIKEKPYVDFLHIWFADGINNLCECDKCMATTPTDQLIQLLNETDKAFSDNGIDTRIVFELYNDSAWPPIFEKLNNPSRFTIMPCIRQDYVNGYENYNKDYKIPEHIHNNYTLPRKDASVALAFRKAWESVFEGDCFFFDYHLYSDHYVDPGYRKISTRLYRDMKLLSSFNSQGIMHCSSQRRSIPNTYPMYMCGEVLRNVSLSEEEIAQEYFSSAYGKDGEKAAQYLTKLSDLFCPELLRDKEVAADEEMYTDVNVKIVLPYMYNKEAYKKFSQISDAIDEFLPTIQENISHPDKCIRRSWEILELQIPILKKLSEGLMFGAAGQMDKAQQTGMELIDFLAKNDDIYSDILDYGLIVRRIRVTFGFTSNIFESIKGI